MRRIVLLLMLCGLTTASTIGQTAAKSEISGAGAPTGACTITSSGYSQTYVNRSNGDHYNCQGAKGTHAGTWVLNGNHSVISGLTTNTIPKATSATTLGNSQITDDGTNIIISASGNSILRATNEADIDSGAGTTIIGDVGGAGNSTTLTVDDAQSKITASGLLLVTSGIDLQGASIVTAGDYSPITAGAKKIGTIDLPLASVFVGNAANNSAQLTGTFTGNRVATFQDQTGTVGLIASAPAISATKTANFTVLTFTPLASAGVYRVGGVITTTSATNTGTVQFTLDYKDSQGTTHTADIIPLMDAAGTSATTKTGASKEFHAIDWQFTINNSATNIVLKVVITGSVSYTVVGSVERIQ